MSIWMEIRCDLRKSGCCSDRNNGPMRSSGNTAVEVTDSLRMLKQEAREVGWVTGPRDATWICPSCKEKL